MGSISGRLSSAINIGGSVSGQSEIRGGMNSSGFPYVISDTTANWTSKTSLISKKNVIYVYTDYKTNDDGKYIPGIKVGDGLAYVVDLPFIDELMWDHINDKDIHVTLMDKIFWNNKNRAYADGEELILTTL